MTETGPDPVPSPDSVPSLADKLDRLFRIVRPPGEDREYSYREVSAAVAERGGPATSENYLYLLRSGRRDNPGKKLIEALAGFFGTNVAYFYDATMDSQALDDELKLLAALRDSSIRQLALRSFDLSKGNLRHIMGIVEQIREMEGLPGEARPSVEEWSDERPD
jgi:hypothetical protein